ncbi:lipase [Thalassotalea sp. M1531]|uniref:Lipase n=1 Tax=Thalassotalea algicola TaxID=2716224 RepID=A0A7Y0Q5U6_9GAMM|nr:VolA/Pla-1 family phospholipase [Thalassotalea algicola]NMP31339.1 lipase [Thalassotalea algicola]
MKKLVLSMAIAGALGLSGCGDETIKDVQENVDKNGAVTSPTARVVFDPSNGVLSVPNDLLFSGTTDGTLNMPVADPTDFADPTVALSALDGWSTVQPFVLDIDFPAGVSLDGNSVFNPASVRVFETEMGGPLAASAGCQALPQGTACQVIGELTFGSDFVTQKSGNSIAVVPLKPLKAKTSYVVVLTNSLMDDTGKAVAGSTTYELVQQDLATKPLGSQSQKDLQGVINSFEAAVAAAGVDKSTIIYTMAMTTQSTADAVGTLKQVMAQNAGLGQVPTIGIQDTTLSVYDVLTSQGIVLPPELAPVYQAANYMQGSITLPYYLGTPSAENPMAPVNDWWKAQCDSAVMLAGLAAQNPDAIPANPVSETDGLCMALSAAAGLPAPGLRDLSTVLPLDTERNITKFNPLPAKRVDMALDVQVTTPDLAVANAVRASLGMPALEEPATGWPVAILQHGITSKKEDMLAITGALALQGIATAAIDHPLHGSRGFDLDPTQPGDEINASTVSATHYMNLANLLTTRDNLRQSTIDTLGLRLGLNFAGGLDATGNPIKLNGQQVTYLGHSLGAITGINTVALANLPLDPAVDPLFRVAATSFAMPGVGVANFLLESAAFGGLIRASLTLAASPEFQAFVAQTFPAGPSEAELVQAFDMFFAALTPAQQGELNGTFAQFTFAAQTVTGSGDPVNYASMLAMTQTPTHLIEVVGNGADNLPDQVIPNAVSSMPLSGTEAAIALLGLSGVSETTEGSGAVRFVAGHHGSILDPSARPESPDPLMSAAATTEMQTQVTTFFATLGQLISVTNTDVVM